MPSYQPQPLSPCYPPHPAFIRRPFLLMPAHSRPAATPKNTTRRLAIMTLALRGIEADHMDCMVALPLYPDTFPLHF